MKYWYVLYWKLNDTHFNASYWQIVEAVGDGLNDMIKQEIKRGHCDCLYEGTDLICGLAIARIEEYCKLHSLEMPRIQQFL